MVNHSNAIYERPTFQADLYRILLRRLSGLFSTCHHRHSVVVLIESTQIELQIADLQ